MLVFRKARMEDKEDIINISKTVWDGDDYLPNIYEKWVANSNGEFTIAELDGKAIGCAKFTDLGGKKYWFEGIRVNKQYRGMGIGKKITRYYIDKAKNKGYNSISLSTYIENYESIKIIESFGFKNTTKFKLFYHENSNPLINIKVYEKANSLEEVRYILKSKELSKRNGYFAFDWTFVKATEELLQELIDEGSVYTLKENGKIKSTIILSNRMSKNNELSISYIDGDECHVEGLKFATQKYQEKGYKALLYMCPQIDSMKEYAVKAGLMPFDEYDEDVFVYEYI
ncbi:GNAT family N-acetyltransferase [Paramaledivibacter caminithermalis]|jgi:RimJ/RimL family protein N-acetyltransferase|uniref:L-amino acid N-acyltransferase YncA n=1 Tax=Paramaledivibacter caminithermalis (strain DSM 15212 / CIP 107654 / DViRD3) TaxID=1121301 RepID=A0A1M6MZZ1_PARC5|nr:GNAT family N-acetyltransferase [Paramaledivibacter caminithermalis]SHJ89049.1 L-amino acid N-acyltransferase YncA [Paramaledivibacter caminithermalis DSM 15212]